MTFKLLLLTIIFNLSIKVYDILIGVDGDRMSRSELVDTHRQLSASISDLNAKLTALQAIQQELKETYDISKGYCCCFKLVYYIVYLAHMLQVTILLYDGL